MYNEYAIKYGLCKRKYKYYVSAPEIFFAVILPTWFHQWLALLYTYVLTDFETSAMAADMSTWPTTELRGCRSHLGQSWWRRIQQIGLACSYNDRNSDIAKWLLNFFGLSLLPANEIEDAFAEDIMDDAPSDAKCVELADYVYND